MKRLLTSLFARKRVRLAPPTSISLEELVSGFAVPENHPLWKSVNAVIDQAMVDLLNDAVDPESLGEENAIRRGAANAVVELKTQLEDLRAQAMRQSKG